MGQNPSSPSLNINNINLNNHHHHHHRQPSSSSPHNHHDHQYNGTSPTADISEEELTTDSTSATTPTMTQSSLSSTLISRRRSSLPHKLKDNSTVGNEEEQEETKRLAKVFKSATHLNVDEDVGNYSLGKHLWDVDKASNSSCSDDSQHFQDSSQQQSKDTTVITADNDKKHLTIKSKRNNTLPLTITKENESPVHRSNTHPHLSSRNFQDQQKPVTYSNNSNTPNSATHKTSQKLIKLKPFSTPDLKRTALLNVRNQEDTNGVDLDILTPTVSDDASFSSSSVYSPPQHANSFRNSVLSTTSSASGGSSNVHNNGLIHSLFPSLPVDRSKMTDEEFGVYKEVISKPVYEKILKSKPLTAKCGFNEEYMKEFAFELSDEEELKNTYLTTDWVETAKLLQRTRSIDETTLNLDPSTLLEPIANSVSKRDSLSSIEEEVKKIVMEEQEVLKQDIKIKLIITEIANAPTKTLRQFLSPVLHKMNVLPEIGWFHSAILVGKWRLDFNDSSVVIPRKLVSQAAVITTDIETISTLEDLNRVIDGMSRCICKWNRSITYKQTGGDRINTGNCQDFVEDLLESIGVKMNLSGSMKKFVKRLRKTGKCSLVFEMDKRFREYFGMESKRVKFKSHEQLDLFVRKLLDKCPNFAQEFNDEWTLLQSFDRTYWLKHITYTHIEEYKPYKVIRDNKGVPDCPFHEPEFTNLLKD